MSNEFCNWDRQFINCSQIEPENIFVKHMDTLCMYNVHLSAVLPWKLIPNCGTTSSRSALICVASLFRYFAYILP